MERLADLVEQATGISVTPEAQADGFLPSYAEESAMRLGLPSVEHFVERLATEPFSGEEWARLISGFSNGHTCFFRDREQFDCLKALLTRMAAEHAPRPLDLWSSACATGEEAYSLAVLCADLGVEARILATDINASFLGRAREGRYEKWALRYVKPELRQRWFHNDDSGGRVTDPIRRMVRFKRYNLVREPVPTAGRADGKWDLILCRNVLLYFRRERVAAVCRKLAEALAPTGRLALAVSESVHGLELPLVPEFVGQRVVYRKGPPTAPLPMRLPLVPSPRPQAEEALDVTLPPTTLPVVAAPPISSPSRGAALVAPLEGLEEVLRLAELGEVMEAREELQRRLQEPPPLVELLTLGHLCSREHAFDEALDAYQRALALDPLLSEVHYFEGLVHRKQRRLPDAAAALRRAVFLAPGFWQAAWLLAGVYERMGNRREAMRQSSAARRSLKDCPEGIAFLSPPLCVGWFCPDIEEVAHALAKDESREA